jgi:hypothetical protein
MYKYIFWTRGGKVTMFLLFEKIILAMAGLRIFSGLLEVTAGFLILKFNQVEKALMINAVLAVVGPVIFITSMSLGIIHLADKLSYSKLLFIGLGVGFILLGLKK